MHTLTHQQFIAYAAQQIDNAVAMLARHQNGRGGYCSCGRELPCSVAEACHRTHAHYQGKLALLEATATLPMLPAAEERPRVPRWRRLVAGERDLRGDRGPDRGRQAGPGDLTQFSAGGAVDDCR